MQKRVHKGFTLVEVLIVVIIIAILAALILPRMTAQTDRAKLAEGLQMFGAIKRAVETQSSLGAPSNVKLHYDPLRSIEIGDWSAIGINGDYIKKSKNFGYFVYIYEPFDFEVDVWGDPQSTEYMYMYYNCQPARDPNCYWYCSGSVTNDNPYEPCRLK